ncbi:5-oxoprolinase subunit PxpB [Neobacillus sp. LXY-4]|uniref:5-oxoprolinase subunit PxpB n=1 Tax=Neobacillus sp. LXY-4 TaxID=3379826 RepID=UPI003EDEBCDF
MEYHLDPLNEQAIMIIFGKEISEATLNKVQAVASFLETNPFPWLIEYVPAFTTITIYYDPIKVLSISSTGKLPYDFVYEQIDKSIKGITLAEENQARVVSIPVCYGEQYGPDLEFVAKYNHLTTEEVIEIHSGSEYIVYMIGFSPGFPYLGGLSNKIYTPRKSSPRQRIPAGSVGIAGKQTGVYPIETPGGWQIIGQTPITLFQPNSTPPSLLQTGDKIKFFPISHEEFSCWEERNK